MDFRPKYRELNDDEKDFLGDVKARAGALGELLDQIPQSREVSLAKTKLEECVMWAVKGITA